MKSHVMSFQTRTPMTSSTNHQRNLPQDRTTPTSTQQTHHPTCKTKKIKNNNILLKDTSIEQPHLDSTDSKDTPTTIKKIEDPQEMETSARTTEDLKTKINDLTPVRTDDNRDLETTSEDNSENPTSNAICATFLDTVTENAANTRNNKKKTPARTRTFATNAEENTKDHAGQRSVDKPLIQLNKDNPKKGLNNT